jgi:chromosome segregation ATPase
MHMPEAGAYIVRSNDDLEVLDSGEALSASDLLASDLVQAQFDIQDLTEKRNSWSSLCSSKPKGTEEWRQCQGVLDSKSSEVKSKVNEAALLQGRLDKLASPKLTALQVEHGATDASDALTQHLDVANIQLDNLIEKRARWKALCEHPMLQRSVGQQQLFLQRTTSDNQCLEVVQNIEHDMASARKSIASYTAALAGLQKL